MYPNPLTAIDFYKADHRRQYPEGTTEVYSNFSARSSKLANVLADYDDKVVFFGLQFFIKYFLIGAWEQYFFSQYKENVIETYRNRMTKSLLGGSFDIDHISALHDLGYLPLKIKALPEGTRVPIGVPMLTVVNTHPKFFWLTNYIESVMSAYLWKPMTTATTAFEYKKLMLWFANATGGNRNFVPFQCHDFSLRGMSGIEDAALSGAGHLLNFLGTDSVPAIDLLEDYYDAAGEYIGGSIPATEHSVMSMGTKQDELETFRRLITEVYPTGPVSIVSDTWDFWKVIGEYLPALKDVIMNRVGKVVIRPDSGDPKKIICGDPMAPAGSLERKGAMACLYDIFGGSLTATGHKLLHPSIGLIYGDSITLERATTILRYLHDQKFCSENIVFGVGSFTYQYVTRDTFGFAMKATSGVVNEVRRDIFKKPKTDSGKDSKRGLLRVELEDGELVCFDRQTENEEKQGLLETVFLDGHLVKETSLRAIRELLV